jgi:AbrB family looped-hinge helix DNA binding protein
MPLRTVRVRENGQITIPKKLREMFALKKGDIVVVESREDGILIQPRKLIDPTQSWFWSKEWQEKEHQADDDVKVGHVSAPLKGVEELREHLE